MWAVVTQTLYSLDSGTCIAPFLLLKDGGVILGMEPMNVDVGLVMPSASYGTSCSLCVNEPFRWYIQQRIACQKTSSLII